MKGQCMDAGTENESTEGTRPYFLRRQTQQAEVGDGARARVQRALDHLERRGRCWEGTVSDKGSKWHEGLQHTTHAPRYPAPCMAAQHE